ncbi:RDD family protein [Yoonia litorea]|uniref:RDD family protein n=1 Tax=Yoonia litorea TaxID=1123755 RepID=A0A1I6LY97_9RHOB|nr:RDD family protein [Yoonia litorea]SFS08449.1 RDD family protein [Yoonia litorea]
MSTSRDTFDTDHQPELYAGVPLRRGLAWIIDMVFIGIIAAIIVPFTAFTGLFFFPFLMMVVGFFYRWWTIASGSATWGMWLTGVRLRDREGYDLTGGLAFAHTLGYSISVAMPPLQLVSIILMLTTPRGQGLTDMVLGTEAING